MYCYASFSSSKDAISRIISFKISTISRLECFLEKRKVRKAQTALTAAAKVLTHTGLLKYATIFYLNWISQSLFFYSPTTVGG